MTVAAKGSGAWFSVNMTSDAPAAWSRISLSAAFTYIPDGTGTFCPLGMTVLSSP